MLTGKEKRQDFKESNQGDFILLGEHWYDFYYKFIVSFAPITELLCVLA